MRETGPDGRAWFDASGRAHTQLGDDTATFIDTDTQTAGQAALTWFAQIAHVASTHLVVEISEPDGTTASLTFSPDGTMEASPAPEPVPPPPPPAPASPPQAPPIAAPPQVGATTPPTQAPQATDRGEREPVASPTRTGPRVRTIIGAVVAVAVVTALIAGVTLWTLTSTGGPVDAKPTPSSASSATEEPPTEQIFIPAEVPEGWATTAKWSHPASRDVAPVVSADGLVAAATADGAVFIRSVSDGGEVFTEQAAGVPSALAVLAAPEPGFTWQRGSEMHVWSPTQGHRAHTIPDDAVVHAAGTTAMAWVASTTTVRVLDDHDLRKATIPDATVPLGAVAHRDGTLVVSATARPVLWLTRPGSDPTRVNLDHDGDIVAWLGMAGDKVAVAWAAGRPNRATIRIHDVHTGRTTSRVNVERERVTDRPGIARSPDRSRAAFGSVWFGPDAVIVADRAGLRPLLAGDYRFALNAQGKAGSVEADGTFTPTATGTAIPFGIGPDEEAVVRVDGNLYVLPRQDSVSVDQESTPRPSPGDAAGLRM